MLNFFLTPAVAKTIRDPLTEAMLLDFIEKYAWKKQSIQRKSQHLIQFLNLYFFVPVIDEQKIMMPPPRIPPKTI